MQWRLFWHAHVWCRRSFKWCSDLCSGSVSVKAFSWCATPSSPWLQRPCRTRTSTHIYIYISRSQCKWVVSGVAVLFFHPTRNSLGVVPKNNASNQAKWPGLQSDLNARIRVPEFFHRKRDKWISCWHNKLVPLHIYSCVCDHKYRTNYRASMYWSLCKDRHLWNAFTIICIAYTRKSHLRDPKNICAAVLPTTFAELVRGLRLVRGLNQ